MKNPISYVRENASEEGGSNGGDMSLHGPIIKFSILIIIVFLLFFFPLQQPVERNGQVLGHRVINCTHHARTGPMRK